MVEWRYLPSGKVAHAVSHGGANVTPVSWCGIDVGRIDFWRGTGTQEEYETLAMLPRCKSCVRAGYFRCGIVTGFPYLFGLHVWTAEKDDDHRARWTVFRTDAKECPQSGRPVEWCDIDGCDCIAPFVIAGHLDLLWSSYSEQFVLVVRNPDGSLFEATPKRPECGETPVDASSVTSYKNALAWFEMAANKTA